MDRPAKKEKKTWSVATELKLSALFSRFSVGRRGDIIPNKTGCPLFGTEKNWHPRGWATPSSCRTRLAFGSRRCSPLSYKCIRAGSQNPFFHSWWANAIKRSQSKSIKENKKNDSEHKHNQSNNKEGKKNRFLFPGRSVFSLLSLAHGLSVKVKEAIKPTVKRWKKGVKKWKKWCRTRPKWMRSGRWAAGWKEKGVVLLKEARVFGWRWKLLRLNEKKRHCADLHLSYETPFIHYYPHLITTSPAQLPSPFSSITLSEKSARRRRHWSIRVGGEKKRNEQ